jgi:hypothetical protein
MESIDRLWNSPETPGSPSVNPANSSLLTVATFTHLSLRLVETEQLENRHIRCLRTMPNGGQRHRQNLESHEMY